MCLSHGPEQDLLLSPPILLLTSPLDGAFTMTQRIPHRLDSAPHKPSADDVMLLFSPAIHTQQMPLHRPQAARRILKRTHPHQPIFKSPFYSSMAPTGQRSSPAPTAS